MHTRRLMGSGGVPSSETTGVGLETISRRSFRSHLYTHHVLSRTGLSSERGTKKQPGHPTKALGRLLVPFDICFGWCRGFIPIAHFRSEIGLGSPVFFAEAYGCLTSKIAVAGGKSSFWRVFFFFRGPFRESTSLPAKLLLLVIDSCTCSISSRENMDQPLRGN